MFVNNSKLKVQIFKTAHQNIYFYNFFFNISPDDYVVAQFCYKIALFSGSIVTSIISKIKSSARRSKK